MQEILSQIHQHISTTTIAQPYSYTNVHISLTHLHKSVCVYIRSKSEHFKIWHSICQVYPIYVNKQIYVCKCVRYVCARSVPMLIHSLVTGMCQAMSLFQSSELLCLLITHIAKSLQKRTSSAGLGQLGNVLCTPTYCRPFVQTTIIAPPQYPQLPAAQQIASKMYIFKQTNFIYMHQGRLEEKILRIKKKKIDLVQD